MPSPSLEMVAVGWLVQGSLLLVLAVVVVYVVIVVVLGRHPWCLDSIAL